MEREELVPRSNEFDVTKLSCQVEPRDPACKPMTSDLLLTIPRPLLSVEITDLFSVLFLPLGILNAICGSNAPTAQYYMAQ